MPRQPRAHLPEGAYHVVSRGVARAPIFLDDRDRVRFVSLLRSVVLRFSWACHAYCLMPNHVHLVVSCEREQLSRGMQLLNGRYAQGFNDRYDRVGHLFQNRYAAYAIDREDHLREACLYVFQNPVRAGLATTADDWPWSGALDRVREVTIPAPA